MSQVIFHRLPPPKLAFLKRFPSPSVFIPSEGNRTAFMNSATNILQDVSPIVPCLAQFPLMWYVDDAWWRRDADPLMRHLPLKSQHPKSLSHLGYYKAVKADFSLDVLDLTPYSQEQRDATRLFEFMKDSRPAIESQVRTRISPSVNNT